MSSGCSIICAFPATVIYYLYGGIEPWWGTLVRSASRTAKSSAVSASTASKSATRAANSAKAAADYSKQVLQQLRPSLAVQVLDAKKRQFHEATWVDFRKRASFLRIRVSGPAGSGIRNALVMFSVNVECRGSRAENKWLWSVQVVPGGRDAVMSGSSETAPFAPARIPLPTLAFLRDCVATSIGIRSVFRNRTSSDPDLATFGDIRLRRGPIKATKQDVAILSMPRTTILSRDLAVFMERALPPARLVASTINDHVHFQAVLDSSECYATLDNGVIGIRFAGMQNMVVMNLTMGSAVFCADYARFSEERKKTLIKEAKSNVDALRRSAGNLPATLRPTILWLSQEGERLVRKAVQDEDFRQAEAWLARMTGAYLASRCFKGDDQATLRCLEENGFPGKDFPRQAVTASGSEDRELLQLFEKVGSAQALGPPQGSQM